MKLVTIDWGPIICECEQCVCQTEVSFREQGNPTFYTPTSPTNPTQETHYQILIEEGIYYQVRLTFRGPLCQEKSTFFSIYFPVSACCPEGYTMSPDQTYCYQIDDIAATPPSGPVDTLVANQNIAYSTCGSYIYDLGYSINGTGSSTQISPSNPFWVNGAGACVDNTTSDGPLNRTAVWSSVVLSNQDIGFGVCIDLAETKVYYIGIAGDNYATIKVDGVTIVQQDPVALGSQYGVGINAAFKVWHIYPVSLTAGPHILELSCHNDSGPAAIGCEVYDATAAELIAATSYIDLGTKLIFSSKDEVGNDVQLGTGDVGYTCPPGYSLAPCETPIKCRRIVTQAKIDCFSE